MTPFLTPNQNRAVFFILGFILAAFLTCKSDPDKIKIPAVTGTLTDTVKVTHTEYITKEVPIIKNIPYKVIDTIQVAGETIVIKPVDTLKTQNFSKAYEDSHLKINASGIVTGRVESLQIDYTIKPFEVDAQEAAMKFLLGGELRISPEAKEPVLKGGAMFQGKKGNVLSIGYDTQKYWSVGYYKRIF